MKNYGWCFVGLFLSCIFFLSGCSSEVNSMLRHKQLKELQKKQVMVAMWGWPPNEMAPAAKKYGYEVVNQPQGSDIAQHANDIPVWTASGLKMLVRPDLFMVADPFDDEQVKPGYAQLAKVISFHEENNPGAIGYVIQWGMFGEGGFAWGYKFSKKARKAFNEYMGTPGEPLPQAPIEGQPGSMRWVKWFEFRAKKLRQFRKDYLIFAKQFTDKLVGTWSEVYPTDNYVLNMGDAPGADFVFYDLSFGDVTCHQTMAFGECHGEMESFSTFEAWKDHELPLMAKAAGEGVVPIAFQFPMTCGDEVKNIAGKKQFCIDKIEDEYSLKLGPYIRQLMDAVDGRTRKPQVALVYHSYAAAALPAGPEPLFAGNNSVMHLYSKSAKQIEASMHQMGVDMRVIPYEWLEYHDLSQYKIVIVPDPMYLTQEMRTNLKTARRVLYSGEYLMAHRDQDSQSGSFLNEFKASANDTEFGKLNYIKNREGKVEVDAKHPLMKGVQFGEGQKYPADQMFAFEKLPAGSKVIAKVANVPMIITRKSGRAVHVANRAFLHAWHSKEGWVEEGMFTFLKNLLKDSGVNIRVKTPPLARGNAGPTYGSYGVSGYVAWNATGNELEIELTGGEKITIPKFGWTLVSK